VLLCINRHHVTEVYEGTDVEIHVLMKASFCIKQDHSCACQNGKISLVPTLQIENQHSVILNRRQLLNVITQIIPADINCLAFWNVFVIHNACLRVWLAQLYETMDIFTLIYCSNKYTSKIKRCIVNKVVPTCFGANAPSPGNHSTNYNMQFKNRCGHSAPALGTIST
jgi:hypothetical protein